MIWKKLTSLFSLPCGFSFFTFYNPIRHQRLNGIHCNAWPLKPKLSCNSSVGLNNQMVWLTHTKYSPLTCCWVSVIKSFLQRRGVWFAPMGAYWACAARQEAGVWFVEHSRVCSHRSSDAASSQRGWVGDAAWTARSEQAHLCVLRWIEGEWDMKRVNPPTSDTGGQEIVPNPPHQNILIERPC